MAYHRQRAATFMAPVISFTTSKFDLSRETPNPINPIAGEGVLNWIREQLAGTSDTATAPATEDGVVHRRRYTKAVAKVSRTHVHPAYVLRHR